MSVIAIVGASLEELDISDKLRNTLGHKRIANFDFYEGELHGKPVVVLITDWGKVRASQGITILYHNYSISRLFFIGACGGIGEWKQGDVCIPTRFDYFDFNASPLIPAYKYKQFNTRLFVSDANHTCVVNDLKAKFGQRVRNGMALSGDSFISDAGIIHEIEKLKGFDSLNASGINAIVDMESTAIAEACTNLTIDFLVIRIVSDSISANSGNDFNKFLSDTMPEMVDSILKIICK
ncbi:MAG: 5'-methylthioadenosine/S-adenosylhomocysteine nucleosidase [Bacteroidia bacterium]